MSLRGKGFKKPKNIQPSSCFSTSLKPGYGIGCTYVYFFLILFFFCLLISVFKISPFDVMIIHCVVSDVQLHGRWAEEFRR